MTGLPSTDGERLCLLAAWFDQRDLETGSIGDEVQQDLRRMAARLDALDAEERYRRTRSDPPSTDPWGTADPDPGDAA